jgi:hypothetical protein
VEADWLRPQEEATPANTTCLPLHAFSALTGLPLQYAGPANFMLFCVHLGIPLFGGGGQSGKNYLFLMATEMECQCRAMMAPVFYHCPVEEQ